MRRNDREITDFAEIFKVLERCDVIRLGLFGETYPYVVPVSFGCEAGNGEITVYFHGAQTGLKHELLAKCGRVCVEADTFLGYVDTGHSSTANYESVIGFGIAEPVTGQEAVHGLELLLQHCGFSVLPAKQCAARDITRVYRIVLRQITGKRRYPRENEA